MNEKFSNKNITSMNKAVYEICDNSSNIRETYKELYFVKTPYLSTLNRLLPVNMVNLTYKLTTYHSIFLFDVQNNLRILNMTECKMADLKCKYNSMCYDQHKIVCTRSGSKLKMNK